LYFTVGTYWYSTNETFLSKFGIIATIDEVSPDADIIGDCDDEDAGESVADIDEFDEPDPL